MLQYIDIAQSYETKIYKYKVCSMIHERKIE